MKDPVPPLDGWMVPSNKTSGQYILHIRLSNMFGYINSKNKYER